MHFFIFNSFNIIELISTPLSCLSLIEKYFPTEDCKNRVCTFLFSPVCGSDGITYPNACTLEIAACQKPKDKIKITKRGACDVSF